MSALFNAYKQDLLDRATGIDMDTDNIDCALSPAYTFTGSHANLGALGVTLVVETQTTGMGTPTVTDGVYDATDCTYSSVTGAQVTDLIIYKEVGALSADLTIANIDGFTAVTPNGGDITVTWGANIFSF